MAALPEMRDLNKMPREKLPLFDEPLSGHPIEVKLANMKAAILAGSDVNELDHSHGGYHAGRPLHWVMDPGKIDIKIMKDHLPLVKLLLENGADPRLRGRKQNSWPGTPIDEARAILSYDLVAEPHWEVAFPFYKEALALMEQAVERLNGIFQLSVEQSLNANCYKQLRMHLKKLVRNKMKLDRIKLIGEDLFSVALNYGD